MGKKLFFAVFLLTYAAAFAEPPGSSFTGDNDAALVSSDTRYASHLGALAPMFSSKASVPISEPPLSVLLGSRVAQMSVAIFVAILAVVFLAWAIRFFAGRANRFSPPAADLFVDSGSTGSVTKS
jgi:hypothetical protein